MRCHAVDYEIIGHGAQVLEVELDPAETVVGEAGAMCYMEPDIHLETRLGDGSEAEEGLFGKIFSAGKRLMSGESLFMTHFTNQGKSSEKVGFSAPFPGTIVPINLAHFHM